MFCVLLGLGACGDGEVGSSPPFGGGWGGGTDHSPVDVNQDKDENKDKPKNTITAQRGLTINSTVTFVTDPKRPHKQQVSYLPPERARWFLQAPPTSVKGVKRPGPRTLRYRQAGLVYSLAANSGESEIVVGREREETILRLELRRAVFLWPDGFAWTENEVGRHWASLGERGSLEARLGEAGQPLRMEVLSPAGLPLEAMEEINWGREGDLLQPTGFNLVADGRVVWKERVDGVQRSVRFLKSYFLPPDRRRTASTQVVVQETPGEARAILLPKRCEREYPLPANISWQQAVVRAGELAAAEAERLKPLGLAPDGSLRMRLDAAGQPLTVLLILNGSLDAPPENWLERPAQAALSTTLRKAAALSTDTVKGLRTAAVEYLASRGRPPAGAAGPLYGRLDRASPVTGPLQLQLALPSD